ncbi:MAG: tetratricopeptide repeat protein [Pontiellaceae bacterium]|nr:tetratricopeptide repeat protein [Pontiellaceae bacterium]
MSEKQHSKQHAALLKKNKLQQQEVQEVKVIIKKYLVPCVTVIAVVCVGFMVGGLVKSLKQSKLDKACMEMQAANTQMANDPTLAIESYLALADKYDSSPYAPLALMYAARTKFSQGNYKGAEVLFNQLSEDYPEHELALTAEYCSIICAEEQGLTQEAEKQYESFAKKNGESYLFPAARMAQARCLNVLGRQKEALQIYEEISTLNTPWQNTAMDKQALLSKQTAL